MNNLSHELINLDVAITNHLNGTYPRLFTDAIEQNEDLNPAAKPNPPHDPKIYPAAVLCLLCSATLQLFCVMRITVPHRYQDEYYTRGFLAWGSAVLALLLLIISSVMYENAVDELNKVYPHLIASVGPGMIMIGCSFASFAIAGYFLLRGAMSLEPDTDGYNAI